MITTYLVEPHFLNVQRQACHLTLPGFTLHVRSSSDCCITTLLAAALLPALLSQVRDYLVALESHLSEAHRQASRLTAKEVELGEATLEFGQVRLGSLPVRKPCLVVRKCEVAALYCYFACYEQSGEIASRKILRRCNPGCTVTDQKGNNLWLEMRCSDGVVTSLAWSAGTNAQAVLLLLLLLLLVTRL
jgi:hypothetical protein